MKNLTKFSVDCRNCSQVNMALIAESISLLENITTLNLYLGPTKTDSAGNILESMIERDMTPFGNAIFELKNLEIVQLDFCGITLSQARPIFDALIELSKLGKLKNVNCRCSKELKDDMLGYIINVNRIIKENIPTINFMYNFI